MCNMILSAIICGSPFFLSGNADNIVKYSKICEKKTRTILLEKPENENKKGALLYLGGRDSII